MNARDVQECLRLLEAADALLLNAGENLLAAYLSAVIEPLKDLATAIPSAEHVGRFAG